ncbi:Ribonuclease III domain [Dillenia turbinata]|uniref:Ribonuclease III domain n=1 Tax=Dillenia turbinata TaxID=194707 RepID=A0AAN8UHL7_9MAGN
MSDILFKDSKQGNARRFQGARPYKEYIRDSAFDPRRWVAPGQRSIRPVPCSCGVCTRQVPLESNFLTEDKEVVVGKCCDMGHRWMGSKTIADCVEALIGAYYIEGGLVAALHLMKWFSIDAELDHSLVDEAIKSASLFSYIPKANHIDNLEAKLGYQFSNKGLLLEAITHASEQEVGAAGYCYQRLEFLGDSVLDVLITRHLYQSHAEIDPGELTDLRSASVNNENFARVAVRQNFHPHLQHCSRLLYSQIEEYSKSVANTPNSKSFRSAKGPKALGDLVESIAGATLIDTKLDLEAVWRIFKPLLSPLVTPDKLELSPLLVAPIKMQKGGPRTSLFELCKKLQWPMPTFTSAEYKSRCPVEIGEGSERRPVFISFASNITLHIPHYGEIEITGDQRADKKSSLDSAALMMLYELEKRGMLVIGNT